MGEAKRKRGEGPAQGAGGPRPTSTTTVALRYGSATLRVEVRPADADKMLRDIDGVAARIGSGRESAMGWVLEAVRNNEHLAAGGQVVAMVVLWLMCRHPS